MIVFIDTLTLDDHDYLMSVCLKGHRLTLSQVVQELWTIDDVQDDTFQIFDVGNRSRGRKEYFKKRSDDVGKLKLRAEAITALNHYL